jgi:polyisoprenoid-binding protein YceI
MKPFHSFIPPLAAMLMTASGGASAQGALIDRSEIRFVAKQTGGDIKGRFRKWKANVDLRPKEIAKSKAEFEIDMASIDVAGHAKSSGAREPLWFDAEDFPVAKFASTATRATGRDRYEIAGTLSIQGIEKDVLVPVALETDAIGNRVAVGEFTFRRLDFGIGEGSWANTDALADEISVRIRMVLPPSA